MAVNVGQRHVPDTPANRMFYAVDAAKNLAVYTIQICGNEKIFLPKYLATTSMLRNTALTIYENAWMANNVKVVTKEDWDLRRNYQVISAAKCNSLLALIDLSKSLYHLKSNRVKYWAQKTIEVRGLLRKWHESDQERYGKLQ